MNPHFITWEVHYHDGQILREREGYKYDQLPRAGVKGIALHSSEYSGQVMFLPTEGNPNFFYRRRTQIIQGGPSRVLYLIGIWPGFCLQFDPAQEHVTQVDVDIQPLEKEPFASSLN